MLKTKNAWTWSSWTSSRFSLVPISKTTNPATTIIPRLLGLLPPTCRVSLPYYCYFLMKFVQQSYNNMWTQEFTVVPSLKPSIKRVIWRGKISIGIKIDPVVSDRTGARGRSFPLWLTISPLLCCFFCFSCCCFDLNHHDNISTFWLDTLLGTHRCYATRFRTSQIRALSATTSIMLNPGLTTQLGILNNPRNHHHQQSTHPLFLLPDCPHPFPQPNDCSALHVRMMQAQA